MNPALLFAFVCDALIAGLIGAGIGLNAGYSGAPLRRRCNHADEDNERCKGRQSRMCFDGLCVRHCKALHGETCGGSR